MYLEKLSFDLCFSKKERFGSRFGNTKLRIGYPLYLCIFLICCLLFSLPLIWHKTYLSQNERAQYMPNP